MNVLDLFSGIGGFSLALGRVGMHTVAFCERLPDRRWWIRQNFPGIPIFRDVKHVTARTIRRLGPIDIICGGFPCQDISPANTKGDGIDGARSRLAWEMCRIIEELRPRWVVIENSPRLRTRGVDRLIAALEGYGYACWPLVVGARHLLAPHRRDRVWIIGHANGSFQAPRPREVGQGTIADAERIHSDLCGRRQQKGAGECGFSGETSPRTKTQRSSVVATTNPAGNGIRQQPRRCCEKNGADTAEPQNNAHTNGQGQSRLPFDGQVGGGESAQGVDGEPWGWWNDSPGAHLRLDDGLSIEVARQQIAAFGDSVVPGIVEGIGRAIMGQEFGLTTGD